MNLVYHLNAYAKYSLGHDKNNVYDVNADIFAVSLNTDVAILIKSSPFRAPQ